jgi:cytochrome c556
MGLLAREIRIRQEVSMKKILLFASILFIAAIGITAGAQTRGGRATGSGAAPAATPRPAADMNQLMKAIMFSHSNVIFAAQGDDPATIKQDTDPSTSVNPLTSVYGGWQAVENSGLALADSADLLLTPGRVCSNGTLAPVQNADWKTFVEEMRDAGVAAAAAARAKNQDQIVDVSDKVTTSCSDCHQVYRDRATRCAK